MLLFRIVLSVLFDFSDSKYSQSLYYWAFEIVNTLAARYGKVILRSEANRSRSLTTWFSVCVEKDLVPGEHIFDREWGSRVKSVKRIVKKRRGKKTKERVSRLLSVVGVVHKNMGNIIDYYYTLLHWTYAFVFSCLLIIFCVCMNCVTCCYIFCQL